MELDFLVDTTLSLICGQSNLDESSLAIVEPFDIFRKVRDQKIPNIRSTSNVVTIHCPTHQAKATRHEIAPSTMKIQRQAPFSPVSGEFMRGL